MSLSAGKSRNEILNNLMRKGLPESYAVELIDAAFRETYQTSADSTTA